MVNFAKLDCSVGLVFTKDGVYVMEKLVGASNHGHLVGLALFLFLVVIGLNPFIYSFA